MIRDALTLLMEEYPLAANPSGPQRLAAHEFLSDRYESPLDTLVGETDKAGLEDLLSDRNEAMVEAMLSDPSGEDAYAPDTKEMLTERLSDSQTESAAAHTRPSARRRLRKRVARKVAQAVPQAGTTAEWRQAKRETCTRRMYP